MANQTEVYRKIDRKKELVVSLKALLEAQMEAAETLDNKAWELLKVTSATFGLVSGLEITISEGNVGKYFWVVLGSVLLLYFLQVVVIMWAVRPMKWNSVPGGAEGVTRYDTLLKKYIYPDDEDEYLDKLIVDYVGRKKHEGEKETSSSEALLGRWRKLRGKKAEYVEEVLPGAIQVAQKNNKEKGACIQIAAVLFGLIVYGLVLMAVAAVK